MQTLTAEIRPGRSADDSKAEFSRSSRSGRNHALPRVPDAPREGLWRITSLTAIWRTPRATTFTGNRCAEK